jgi:hypothetical protein
MENTEIMTVEPNTQLSSNVFSDPEAFQNLFNIGKMFASSSLVPQAYQNKPMDCTIAVDMANRMGVSPMMVMQNLYVVQGKPQWSGQACTSMIMASGKFKNVHHVYTGERNTDSWGCFLTAEKVDTGKPWLSKFVIYYEILMMFSFNCQAVLDSQVFQPINNCVRTSF